MSILLSGRNKVASSLFAAFVAFLFVPADAEASRCELMSNSFHCMKGAAKNKPLVSKARVKNTSVKKSYKVAALRNKRNDASIPQPVRKSLRKGRKKTGKSKVSRRKVRSKKSVRRSKRSFRKRASLRKIGRRINSRSVRKLTKRSTRPSKRSARSGKKTTKRGWRTRSKGLGYRTANRGVSTSCFPKKLRRLLNKVSAHYGRKLVITSGYRSHRHNRRIGGARRSQHIHCTAADFYIPGVNKYALARYLKTLPGRGGVGTYGGNRIVHLDIGPRRSWHWGGKKKRRYAKKRRYNRKKTSRRVSTRKRVRKRYVARFRGSKS